MDENENKSSWDDLIQDLGAEPDEAAFDRKQPPPQEIPPSVEWSEDTEAEAAPSAPSDWNALAESLGLEAAPEPVVSDPPAEEPEIAPAASSGEAEKGGEPGKDTVEAIDASGSEEAVEDTDAVDEYSFGGSLASEEPSDEQTNEADVEPALPEQDELPPLPSQMDQALSDTAWSDESDDMASAEDAAEGDLDSQGITGEAARSAFDALFSDGASTWGSAFLEKPKRDFLQPAQDASSDEGDEVARSLEIESSADADSASEDGEEDRPKRKRSRRRRRGGRGRKSAGDQATDDQVAAEEAAVDGSLEGSSESEPGEDGSTEDESKKPRRRRSRRRKRTDEKSDEKSDEALASASAVDGEDADDELDDEDRPRAAGRGRQRHRNIPTWSEAIGVIVDSNLEQRAKAPSRSQSSRGGRGRGGRRRGGRKSEGKQ
ncbi:MAG: hypothetical protein AAGD11_02335 [Planctomycetota bacterium]